MKVLRSLALVLSLFSIAGVAHADRGFGGNFGGERGPGNQGPNFDNRGPWHGGDRDGDRREGWGPGRGAGRGDDFGRGPRRGGPGWHDGRGGGWDRGDDRGFPGQGGGFPQGPAFPQQPNFPQGPSYPQQPNFPQPLVPVYRSNTGHSHFWSLDAYEGQRAGFLQEGIGFYTFANAGYGMAPIFRCFTGGAHFISRDAYCEGQRQEGTLGNVALNPSPQAPKVLSRCFNGLSHLITTNVQECYQNGYQVEGQLGFVP